LVLRAGTAGGSPLCAPTAAQESWCGVWRSQHRALKGSGWQEQRAGRARSQGR